MRVASALTRDDGGRRRGERRDRVPVGLDLRDGGRILVDGRHRRGAGDFGILVR